MKGVRQGATLSPAAVEEIFRMTTTKEAGININGKKKKQNNLRFAGAIILFCKREELKTLLETELRGKERRDEAKKDDQDHVQ